MVAMEAIQPARERKVGMEGIRETEVRILA